MVRLLGHHRHPFFGDWLLEVERPARYVGCEYGVARKPRGSVLSRFLLAFPDLYEIGMSHLGMRILYQVVNAHPDLCCERAFMVWPDMEGALRSRKLPLVSLETATPMADFDVIGFSLQYELNYTNVLAMLDLGPVPLRSHQRTESDPLVLAGGLVASHAEPLSPFVDLFVLGEAERILPRILLADAEMRQAGASRSERIAELDRMEPCFAPALHPAAHDPSSGRQVVALPPDGSPLAVRTWVESLDEVPDPSLGPVPAVEAVFDRISVEVMRGCIQGCRFCQPGFLYRPARERTPGQSAGILSEALARTGWDEAALTGLSPADHSQLEELVRRAAEVLGPAHGSVSVSSLRAYGLPGSVLDDLRTGRGGGLTFALEAGTERLRNVVNKNVSAEELIHTASEVALRGWSRIKLYFMIGLPTETDEDVQAIVDLGLQVHKAARSAAPRRAPVVTASVSVFVPKPHTPFQWAPMIPLAEIRRKQALLKRRALGTPLKLRLHGPKTSILEAVLARGDRRLSDVVQRAVELGCRFDGWEDQFDWKGWARAFKECGLHLESYLEPLEPGGRLCWDHLGVGIDSKFLSREYRRALAAEPTAVCGARIGSGGGGGPNVLCHHCGVQCDLDAMGADGPPGPILPGGSGPDSPVVTLNFDPPKRYVVVYSKVGPATLWGHLDLIRHLPRAFRRAGFMPSYSGGFHPKPQFTFGPALPLGWQGLGEVAEVKLEAIPHEPPDVLLDRLRESAPEGLEIRALTELDPSAAKLQRSLSGADHLFELTVDDRAQVDRAIHSAAELMSCGEAVVQVERKKGVRTLDLRPFVADLEVRPAHAPDHEGRVLEVRLSLRFGGPRPLEVVDYVAPAASAVRAWRLGFFIEHEGRRTPFAVPLGPEDRQA